MIKKEKTWEFRVITPRTRRLLGGRNGGVVRYHNQHGFRAAFRVDGQVVEVPAGFVRQARPRKEHRALLGATKFKALFQARPADAPLFFAIPIGKHLGSWEPKTKKKKPKQKT